MSANIGESSYKFCAIYPVATEDCWWRESELKVKVYIRIARLPKGIGLEEVLSALNLLAIL